MTVCVLGLQKMILQQYCRFMTSHFDCQLLENLEVVTVIYFFAHLS